MSTRSDELEELQNWYRAQCDGDWEHGSGVKIDTLDNPGWSLSIELAELPHLINKPFERREINRTEHDWVHAKIEQRIFRAAGGPLNLREMLRIFLDWAKG